MIFENICGILWTIKYNSCFHLKASLQQIVMEEGCLLCIKLIDIKFSLLWNNGVLYTYCTSPFIVAEKDSWFIRRVTIKLVFYVVFIVIQFYGIFCMKDGTFVGAPIINNIISTLTYLSEWKCFFMKEAVKMWCTLFKKYSTL